MNDGPKQDPGEERLLDHNYDGMQEDDNPLPRWWVGLFWATIVFSVVYYVNVIPGIGTGAGRIANYEKEMQAARTAGAGPGGPDPRPVAPGGRGETKKRKGRAGPPVRRPRPRRPRTRVWCSRVSGCSRSPGIRPRSPRE